MECISYLILYLVVSLFLVPCNRHLEKIFKKECGVTPMRYLKRHRYQQARDLMRNGSHSVKSVALLTLAGKLGLGPEGVRERWQRVSEMPFHPSSKIMATLDRDGHSRFRISLKGGPEGSPL